ncbi:MAG TPA: hypothetical protein VF599_04875 [Pyrinomonadaceae bacterium]|jgi:hypothetical protein
MQELGLAESLSRKGFRRQQFQKEATESQRNFDWIFGVVLPVICFALDPIVFKSGFGEPSLLGDLKPFAYALSFVSVMAMAAWLIWGARLKWMNAFLAGLFAVGGLISLVVGIILLPFSLLGLFFLIGILGFTPLFTSIVFLRNAIRAFDTAKPFLERGVLLNSFMLSAIFSLCLPAVLNIQIKSALDEIRHGDAQTVRAQAAKLKYVAPLVDFSGFAARHNFRTSQMDEGKRAALAEAYRELTGEKTDGSGFGFD